MASIHRVCAAAAVALFLMGVSTAEEREDPAKPQADAMADGGAAHVRAALEAELAGDNTAREKELKLALSVDPDQAAARWHSGEVQYGGKWHAVRQVMEQGKADDLLARYDLERLKALDTEQSQYALGTWCKSQGLHEEARAHLLRVLQKKPDHAGALKQLGVHWVHGELLTAQEVAAEAAAKSQAQASWRDWSQTLPPLVKMYRRAGDDAGTRNHVVHEIESISDPLAIPALEAFVSSQNAELAVCVVNALDKMPEQEATDSLLRHAVSHADAKVTSAAVDALKKRSIYGYAPQLLAAMQSKIVGRSEISERPTGATFIFGLFREDQGARYQLVRGESVDSYLYVSDTVVSRRGLFPPRTIESVQANESVAARAALAEQQLRANVSQINGAIQLQNERVGSLLAALTNRPTSADPSVWWKWWSELNEFEQSDKPLISDSGFSRRRFVREVSSIRYMSCFPRGTPVWTIRGVMPIERVRIGDRVLSQDAETGEIAFKPVLERTTRKQTDILKLSLAGEVLRCTKGHPFWVNGQGWKMAKNLKAGDRLHSLNGAVEIDQIEPDPQQVAYNLVVERFHSYFVGDAALLVHDNVIRETTAAIVPGLIAERKGME